MKKIRYLAPVQSMSGKFAQEGEIANSITGNQFFVGHSRTYTNGNLTNYFGIRRNGYIGDLTASQLAIQARFRQIHAAARSLPSDNPDKYAELRSRYNSQHKYKTLQGYIFAALWREAESNPNTGGD